jgi:hypothetical protein
MIFYVIARGGVFDRRGSYPWLGWVQPGPQSPDPETQGALIAPMFGNPPAHCALHQTPLRRSGVDCHSLVQGES